MYSKTRFDYLGDYDRENMTDEQYQAHCESVLPQLIIELSQMRFEIEEAQFKIKKMYEI